MSKYLTYEEKIEAESAHFNEETHDWTEDSNELELCVVNDGSIIDQRNIIEAMGQSEFNTSLKNPFDKRAYRSKRAVKRWLNWVNQGAISYKLGLSNPLEWYDIFSYKTRLEVAHTMEEEHFEIMESKVDISDDQVLIMRSKHS
jgi:TPP-dependent indolepyruvate ferredoxin oxidoreductase alpha subunit